MKRLKNLLQTHAAAWHTTSECAHMAYFAMVAFGGPYHIAAAGLLALTIVTLAVREN